MLETARLLIRPTTYADIPFLFALNSDPDVVRFTGDEAFTNEHEVRRIIDERMVPQFRDHKMGRFMVTLKDGTPLGWCGLKFFPETNEVDLGYRFMKKYWGQGFATESAAANLTYGFRTLGLSRIIAKAMPDNQASLRVMHKLGMNFRGYHHDPTDPHPFILYDITAAEWKG